MIVLALKSFHERRHMPIKDTIMRSLYLEAINIEKFVMFLGIIKIFILLLLFPEVAFVPIVILFLKRFTLIRIKKSNILFLLKKN